MALCSFLSAVFALCLFPLPLLDFLCYNEK